MAYAALCLPVYERYYPEITQEIRGIADGQKCDVSILEAVLFGMYVMPPVCNCSCFALNTGREILLGRNSDFPPELEKLNLNVIYDLTNGAYSFTGNTTAFVEIEDGVNEYGLAAGLTSVYPRQYKIGFNAGMLLRYLLEKCKNVSEAISRLRMLPVASAQTLILADTSGEIALVECDSSGMETATSMTGSCPFVCATNRFHLPKMAGHNSEGIDDWFARTRFKTMISAFQNNEDIGLPFAQRLLSGDYGFLCQYDRAAGKDTVWSVIYDLKRHEIYRSEANPRRAGFKVDTRFHF